MTNTYTETTMLNQFRTAPISTEQGPDPDDDLRQLYIELADSLPNGRASLGMYSYRVSKAVAKTYHPRMSDFVMLVKTGANPARIALALANVADLLMDTPIGCDSPVMPFGAVVREVSEATMAAAEYLAAPCPQTEKRTLKETADAVAALTLHSRHVGASRRARATTRQTPLGTMGVVR